jgi:methylmalonyl-CoA/ethylmalonyl-CoA epimerase
LPDREARALRAKIMRRASLPGLGGQVVLFPKTEVLPCRDARPGARWARLALRKDGGISEWNSFPADAFCAQRPCFPATSLLLSRKENRKSEGGPGESHFSPLGVNRRDILFLQSNARGDRKSRLLLEMEFFPGNMIPIFIPLKARGRVPGKAAEKFPKEEREMFKKVDHMAIAVKNLEDTKKKLELLLGAKFIVENLNEKDQYKVAIFRLGENIFSFLESTSPDGFVAKHIEKSGETMQHMGIEVDDIKKFMDHLHANGVKTSNYVEIAGVRKEVLVGPRNPLGAILQVFEWLGEYRDATPETRMTKVWG